MEKSVAKGLLEANTIYYAFKESEGYLGKYRNPIFCDTRKILMNPKLRNIIGRWISKIIKKDFPDADIVIGTAIKGISLALLASEISNVPMGYMWSPLDTRAGHDEWLESLKEGTRVVIIDDVIDTGSTLVATAKKLREKKCEVLGAICIFSYEIDSVKEKMEKQNIPYRMLTSFEALSLVGVQTGRITYEEYLRTLEYQKNPYNGIFNEQ